MNNLNKELKLLNKNKQKLSIQVERISSKGDILIIKGMFKLYKFNLNGINLICIGRENKKKYVCNRVAYEKRVSEKNGISQYSFQIDLSFREINQGELLEEDIYDLYLKFNGEQSELVRVGRPTFKAKQFIRESIYKKKDNLMVVNPYYTFKMKNLSLDIEHYPTVTFNFIQKAMRWSWIIRILLYPLNIWIIGERIYKAQDTGYIFFKYLRKEYPNRNVFYVMDFIYPESDKIVNIGNGLNYRSKKHILYTIGARRIISSHHPEYLYPSKMNRFKRRVKGERIFLQHGVLGTKNMMKNYGNIDNGFNVDEFIVSSDREKNIVVNDLKYNSKHVHITGLSRFDELFKHDTEIKRQILIIPTWRDWITTAKEFTETEYFNRYYELITSKELAYLSSKYQFSIVFCLHPNMQMYAHLFEKNNTSKVKIVKQGEVDVQRLLKESSLMITDYSSVAFDFSFLDKPIIYYQFDREKFLGPEGSHLDLDNDLPGEICFGETELLKLVEFYNENNFKNPTKYKIRSDKFIKYKDQSSCDRIYEVVKNAKKSDNRIKNHWLLIIVREIYHRARSIFVKGKSKKR